MLILNLFEFDGKHYLCAVLLVNGNKIYGPNILYDKLNIEESCSYSVLLLVKEIVLNIYKQRNFAIEYIKNKNGSISNTTLEALDNLRSELGWLKHAGKYLHLVSRLYNILHAVKILCPPVSSPFFTTYNEKIKFLEFLLRLNSPYSFVNFINNKLQKPIQMSLLF